MDGVASKRDLLVDLGYSESIVFENPDFDEAIVGVSVEGDRVIYDYQRMVESLSRKDGMTQEESEDFIWYNTIRSLPYMGEKAPIIIYPIG